MASARKVAAQRGIRPGPNLAIPKGKSPLPKTAPVTGATQVRNDHKANRGGKARG